MQVRKIVTVREVIEADDLGEPCTPITRVAQIAVVRNPFADQPTQDLSTLWDMGGALSEQLAADGIALLPGPPVSYGKAAIVGMAGDMEHGAAMLHPKLGKPLREAIGGGEALIPGNAKIGVPGTAIDLPLGHKDIAWSFDHFDTLTLSLADAPRPNEILLCFAVADGGRPNPRCGSGPVTT